jgi:hypothetical protein
VSCFLVQDSTIRTIAAAHQALVKEQRFTADATAVAALLHRANVQSYLARYKDHRPEVGTAPAVTWEDFDRVRSLASTKPGTLAKLLDCYDYQSCEVDGYDTSQALEITNAIRRALLRALPGYEDGPWE